MKKTWSLRIAVLFTIIGSLLLSAAAPMPVRVSSLAENDDVRLTIQNRSLKGISLRLSGPAYYFFSVPGEETSVFTVARGTYKYTLYGCGSTSTAKLDMSRQKILVMPICGGAATYTQKHPNTIDLSKTLKVVLVTIENKSTTNMLAIFTGASTYVFSLKKNQSKDVSIARGDYKIKYYACGTVTTRSFYANKGSSLTLRCPK